MIKIHYRTDKVLAFNKLDDEVSRHTLISSLMTLEEMQRFFVGKQAGLVVESLGFKPNKKEKINCETLEKYFKSQL